ncbi:phage tail protein [Chitinophaga sp. Cy-1792]|uniref:phage tail protein n=1 Tax=Chitinophaga sp. Cy-1792 TaxID=2608339 RepID=UPI00141F988F|nr:tail fiber protein [Chitinophaga sp. Cy-1792]NIG54506.1 phage tail protein [Chitinophaga sp. Cy-1792]
MQPPYIGEIRLFAEAKVPIGWVPCNGQLMEINGNEALYTVIGTTYGGDGVQNFGIPNLQGRVPIHQGQLNGYNFTLGEAGGSERITLSVANIPPHTHKITGQVYMPAYGENPATQMYATGNHPAVNPGLVQYSYSPVVQSPPIKMADLSVVSSGLTKTTLDVNYTGGSQPFDIMQPYVTVNFMIAIAGVFPSQF